MQANPVLSKKRECAPSINFKKQLKIIKLLPVTRSKVVRENCLISFSCVEYSIDFFIQINMTVPARPIDYYLIIPYRIFYTGSKFAYSLRNKTSLPLDIYAKEIPFSG